MRFVLDPFAFLLFYPACKTGCGVLYSVSPTLMRWKMNRNKRGPVLPLFLSGLLLFVCALSSSASLHQWFHHDAGSAEHQCAASEFARGHVDSVPVAALLP